MKASKRFDMFVMRVAKQADYFQFAPTGSGQFASDPFRNARETLQCVPDLIRDRITNDHALPPGFRCCRRGLFHAAAGTAPARGSGFFENAAGSLTSARSGYPTASVGQRMSFRRSRRLSAFLAISGYRSRYASATSPSTSRRITGSSSVAALRYPTANIGSFRNSPRSHSKWSTPMSFMIPRCYGLVSRRLAFQSLSRFCAVAMSARCVFLSPPHRRRITSLSIIAKYTRYPGP